MRKVILIIGLEKWRELIDQGMSFILGLGKDIPLTVIEETKLYLESIWNKRIKRLINKMVKEA